MDIEMLDRWRTCRDAFRLCKRTEDKAVAYVAKCKTSERDLEEQFKILMELKKNLTRTVHKIDAVASESRELIFKQSRNLNRQRNFVFCSNVLSIVKKILDNVQVFVWNKLVRGTTDVMVLVE